MPLKLSGEPRAKLVRALTVAQVRCPDIMGALYMLHFRGYEMENHLIDSTLEHAREQTEQVLAAIDEARAAWGSTLNRAYDEGFAACPGTVANPYKWESEEFAAWADGWKDRDAQIPQE